MIQRQSSVLDQYDRPVPGAEIYVYNSVNDALAVLTSDGVTPLAQPIETDPFGVYSYWADTGVYLEEVRYGGKLRYREAGIGIGSPSPPTEAVATRTALADVTGMAAGNARRLSEAGREGTFQFDSSNLSAQVTGDPQQGVYVAPAAAPTGASGAWVRKFSGPLDARWFGAVADDATDCRAAAVAAVAFINSQGGGTLYFPGEYLTSGSIACCANLTIRGDAKTGSTIRSTHAGTGTLKAGVQSGSIFYMESAINSSTPANVRIQDIKLKNTHASNIGAGFYDQGGTFVSLQNVNFEGFKYGIVFDQTELADVDLCTFNAQLTGGTWLVNGPDLNAAASGGFTNRISINRCGFNEGTSAYGIIDDGGTVHSYIDNNYNGCLNHIRAAGCLGLKISGGEFESAVGACVRFEGTRLSGGAAGVCAAVYIGGGVALIPTVGQNCVIAFSLGDIIFSGVFFGNTAVVKFAGTGNTNAIYALDVSNGGGGATFDGRATNHWEAGSNGTDAKVRTNLPIEISGTVAIDASRNAVLNNITQASAAQHIFDDVGGATFQGLTERVIASPYRYHSIVSKGGGGWQGAYRVRLNYNAGALFDAITILANTDGTTAAASVTGTINASVHYKVAGTQVVGARDTGWAADTGTAKKTATAAYVVGAGLTVGAAYVQAEVTAIITRQALMEAALRDATQEIKALKDLVLAHGLAGA